jgi:nitrate reductase alpha subunit
MAMARKKKPRPRSGKRVGKLETIVVNEEQRARWQQAADKAGLNRSEWERTRLDAAANRELYP